MSFALMGAMGLVLDSGRVYATHSQMQAFADYVALAAANELDGQSDSIARASQAAYGIVDGSEGKILQEKDSGGVVLNIDRLYFYSDLNTASGWQNNMADSQEFLLGFTDQALGSTDAAASESATYVTA
ncbi:MAG: Tad domain-containing protein, partial [Pseudomonadota bacterium]